MKINNKDYFINVRPDEEFWQASLVTIDGEEFMSRYGDTAGEAKRLLQDAITDLGFRENENNVYVKWEDLSEKQRKRIYSLGRKNKMKVLSEWGTSEEHFRNWQSLMLEETESFYPHKLGKSIYDRV